jgi:ubiquinone biosynthesis protein
MIRWVNVIIVGIKYGLDEYLASHEKTRFLNLAGTFVRRMFQVKQLEGTIGYRLRLALQELGPVFIKFGQIASTRRDLLSEDVANELANLKDNVAPISGSVIIEIIERELGKPINGIFSEFSIEPLASASVAQVHAARLPTGEEVVVKVLRPNIQHTIESDLKMFKEVISSIQFFKTNLKVFNILGMIDELEISILQELDLELEADNADQFRKNLIDFPNVHVPIMYKHLSTKQVLVMERMYGTPIDNVVTLSDKNINLKEIAKQGLELLIIQVFRDRFFHADQHSGNVWIADDGSRIYLDFGIMGRLTKTDRDIASELIRALAFKNYAEFVQIQIRAGWARSNVDQRSLERSIRSIDGLLNKKSFSAAFSRLLSIGETHGIKVPVQFTLLVKTLIAMEGMLRIIDPDIKIHAIGGAIMLKHFSKYLKK